MRVFLSYSIGFFFRVIIQRHVAEAEWKFHINPYVFTVCNWMPNRDSGNILSSLRKQGMMTRVSDACHWGLSLPEWVHQILIILYMFGFKGKNSTRARREGLYLFYNLCGLSCILWMAQTAFQNIWKRKCQINCCLKAFYRSENYCEFKASFDAYCNHQYS